MLPGGGDREPPAFQVDGNCNHGRWLRDEVKEQKNCQEMSPLPS